MATSLRPTVPKPIDVPSVRLRVRESFRCLEEAEIALDPVHTTARVPLPNGYGRPYLELGTLSHDPLAGQLADQLHEASVVVARVLDTLARIEHARVGS